VVGSLRKRYPNIAFEAVGIDTYGDKDKLTPISDVEGSDFFTKEIDDALLRGDVDFAVHSAKDLPDEIQAGMYVAAITRSIDPSDALISKGNVKIGELKGGARVGASSQRRKSQLKRYRGDFQIVDIRGTIEERLKILEADGLDAIIVAACALVRLGLEDKITERLSAVIFAPHPLQGSLAVVAREDDYRMIELLEPLSKDEK